MSPRGSPGVISTSFRWPSRLMTALTLRPDGVSGTSRANCRAPCRGGPCGRPTATTRVAGTAGQPQGLLVQRGNHKGCPYRADLDMAKTPATTTVRETRAQILERVEREKIKFMRLQFTDILGT